MDAEQPPSRTPTYISPFADYVSDLKLWDLIMMDHVVARIIGNNILKTRFILKVIRCEEVGSIWSYRCR